MALMALLANGAHSIGISELDVEAVAGGAIVLNAKRQDNNIAKRPTNIDHFFI